MRTHVLPWAITEPARLSKRARHLLADESNYLLFSEAGHEDPFDYLMAAQCLAEDLVLVTADPVFATLGVRALW